MNSQRGILNEATSTKERHCEKRASEFGESEGISKWTGSNRICGHLIRDKYKMQMRPWS